MKEQNPEKVKELEFSLRDYIQNNKSLKGQTIDGYTVMRELGRGAFGEVYYAKNNKNQYFALKLLNLQQLKEERNPKVKEIRWRLVKSQPALMMQCNSPNVLKCYQILENEELKILVLEYCNGRTLEDYIKRKKRLSQEEAVKILRQIINGVAELHRHSIVHRDLKAENVMDHEGCYKIIDLGFSKKLEISEERAEIKGTTLGTVTTMAPEVMSRKNYGLKADIWSIGVIFFQMIFGKMPYDSISAKQRYDQIEKKQYFNPNKPLTIDEVTASKEASDFFAKVFQVETEKRMDWRELLEHPLIKQKENEPLGPRFLQRQKIEQPIVHKSLIDQNLHDTVQDENEDKPLLEEKPKEEQKPKNTMPTRFKLPLQQPKNQVKLQIIEPHPPKLQVIEPKPPKLQIVEPKPPQLQIIKPIKPIFPQKSLQDSDIKQSFHQHSSPEYRWCQQSHLQCQKTELIMNNIIVPLKQNNFFKLDERKAAELMFLLIARCFNNMSPIEYKIETQKDKADPKVMNLYDQVKHLYSRVMRQFWDAADRLTAIEDKVVNIMKDFFPKRLSKKHQDKSKITSGIEKVDYEKNEQIDFTYINYIAEVQGRVNSGNLLKLYLRNYLKLMKVSFDDLKGQDYSEYVRKSLI